MTNSKMTKRALLTSVMALVLCFAMLTGTTFAWFTDQETSGNNQIIAGNLDIAMYNSIADYTDATRITTNSQFKLFDDVALWEPGAVAYENISVVNEGNLALKYQISLNFEDKGLASALQVAVVEGGIDAATYPETSAGRTALIAAIDANTTNTWAPLASFSKTGNLYVDDGVGEKEVTATTYGIAVYWKPADNDNDYNVTGTGTQPSVDFGIKLIATQLAAELDAFGPEYDEDAIYADVVVKNEAELKQAIADGKELIAVNGNITLTSDISGGTVKLVGVDNSSIDFNANNISAATITYENLFLKTQPRSTSTSDIPANSWYGGIDYKNRVESNYVNCTIEGIFTPYAPTVNVTGCTFNPFVYNGEEYYNIFVYSSEEVNIDNCTFNYEDRAIKVYNEGAKEFVVNIANSKFVAADSFTAVNKALVNVDDTYIKSCVVNIDNIVVDSDIASAPIYNAGINASKTTVNIDGVSSATTATVTDSTELKNVLTGAGLAGAGNTIVTFDGSDIDLTGQTWTPVKVDGYHGADVITIDGNGATITGLTAPLFAGGFAGGSGIVIKNLTIADSNIVGGAAFDATGVGAFVCSVDSMDTITLENCHLRNSKVSGSRTGGLVGWTSGYDVTSDGPVDSYITIKNCSVIGCEITGNGAVGAINGHAGVNPATYTTIDNCIISNNTLISYDDSYRVGIVLGTANVGEVTISNITENNNVVKQINGSVEIPRPDGQSSLYGRFVPNATGKLTINGVAVATN